MTADAARPLIAVTTSEVRRSDRVAPTPQGEPPHHEMALGLTYLRALERAGGLPLVVPPLLVASADSLLDRVDALCLSGGPDLDPRAYGQRRHAETGPVPPFLDHELVELAAACPPELKLASGGKGVLKDAARAVLPAEVIDRPKGYFPVPALSTLEGATLELVRKTMQSAAATGRGLFAEGHVRRLLEAPNDHLTRLEGSKLWQLALLELWLQRHGI